MSSTYPIPPPGITANENMYIEWPQLVIEKILRKITAEESKDMVSVLLNCRLIDKYWNEIIEDDFMKKLTFVVRDPIEFLNLPIVQTRKVRSIKFIKSWLMKPEVKYAAAEKNFIDAISNVIEKVHFSLEDGYQESESESEFELFKLIVGVCTNLQDLFIGELITHKMSSSANLLEKITDKIEIISSNKIHSLVVNMVRFTQGSAIGLATLLSKLPQLREIRLIGSSLEWRAMLNICTNLIEYLNNKSKCGLQLKKLTLPALESCFHEETIDTFNTLLVLCGKKSVVLEGDICYVDLSALINLPEISTAAQVSSNQQQLQQNQSPLFKGKVVGGFTFDEESTFNNASLDLLGDLDMRRLSVYFRTDISSGQLNWIGKLKQLEFLELYPTPTADIGNLENNDNEEELVRTLKQVSFEEFNRAFSAGLSTLKVLIVNGDLFSSKIVFPWAQFFPNLTKLDIRGFYHTTNTIITELTSLETLSELCLFGMGNLEDIAFTADCVDKYSHSDASSSGSASTAVISPAAACFKLLKFLQLHRCPFLTNNCVINGIAKCKTLEKIRIMRCKNMTKECLKFLECKSLFR